MILVDWKGLVFEEIESASFRESGIFVLNGFNGLHLLVGAPSTRQIYCRPALSNKNRIRD